MKKIAFVLNQFSDFNFDELLKKYLRDAEVSLFNYLPNNPKDFDLVVLWNYRKIIHYPGILDNVVIFHASDLPKGRGWATLYNLFKNKCQEYTLCGIKLNNPVDTGDIIVRASFPILPHYTANDLRLFDSELSVRLASEILSRFVGRRISGLPQVGESTYFPRRNPSDSEVDTNLSLKELIPHLRGCEDQYPAFFFNENEKYFIEIRPALKAEFPSDITIEYFDENKS